MQDGAITQNEVVHHHQPPPQSQQLQQQQLNNFNPLLVSSGVLNSNVQNTSESDDLFNKLIINLSSNANL
jgi:hypothetical protein